MRTVAPAPECSCHASCAFCLPPSEMCECSDCVDPNAYNGFSSCSCNPGYYGLATSSSPCQPCASCSGLNYRSGCGGSNAGTCTACTCTSGKYISGGCSGTTPPTCSNCPTCTGLNYRSGCGGLSSGTCTACSCSSGQYISSGCSGTTPPSCSSCPTCSSGNYRSGCGGLSSGTCTSCPSCSSGQYRSGCSGQSSGSCTACPSCSSGQYRSGCSGQSSGSCTACPSCASGQYRAGCSGISSGSCTSCPTCSSGQYRSGCSGVSSGTCTSCSSCSGNNYRVGCGGTSAGSCAACSCSSGQYISSGCSGSTPPTCSNCRTCSSGEYETTACTLTSNRVCTACPTCSSGQYRSGCSGASSGSCVACPSCPSGQYLVGCSGTSPGTCVACGSCSSGQYRSGCGGTSGGSCVACGSCSSGNYRSGCGGTSAGSCVACSSCSSGQYRSGCSGTSAGTCTTCTCASDRYRSSGCSGTSPPVCSVCSTCSAGQYETSSCSYSSNRECAACGSCVTGQYRSGCSGSNPGTCISCPSCSGQNYRSGCSGTNSGSCTACTCPSNHFRTSGCSGTTPPTCAACTDCAIGQKETTACTYGSNRVCAPTSCSGPPSAPSGGEVSFTNGNSHGSTASFSCNTGRRLSGSSSVTCSAPSNDAPWPSSTATCPRNTCSGAPGAPTNGGISFSDGNYHASEATFSCNEGYIVSGPTSIACNAPFDNGAWPSSTTTCDNSGCTNNPSAPTNGAVAFSDGSRHNSVATFSCNTGYRSTGTASVTCNAPSGSVPWPASSPACTANQCSSPPVGPSSGSVSFSNNNFHGSVATFSCNTGYKRTGSASVTCSAPASNQAWPSNTAACPATACASPPGAPSNGQVSFSNSNRHNSVATFTCNTGYRRTGSASVTCSAPSADGTWPSSTASCVATQCTSPPSAPGNGNVAFSNGVLHGSVATFSCATGFKCISCGSVTCSAPSADAPWPTSSATCAATACTSPPSAPTGGAVDYSAGNSHGSVATFSCATGYQLTGDETVTCSAPSADTPWPTATATCSRTTCLNTPSAPTNGDVVFSDGNNHGSTASFSCDTGFRLSGSPSITCNSPSGNNPWPSSTATCIANTCSNPPSAPADGAVTFTNGNFHASQADFSCNDGFIVSGSNSITCNAPIGNGNWPTSSTSCIDSGCLANPSPDPNGIVTYSDGSRHESVATFSCNSGYENTGTVSITCEAPTSSRPWPASSPQCTNIDGCTSNDCGTNDDSATCVDLPPPSSSYECSCSPGYQFVYPSCSECPSNTYKDTTSAEACTPCHGDASSPVGSTDPSACTCDFGFHGDGLTCTACTSDPECAVDGTGCVGTVLRCVEANDGYYVDEEGAVIRCPGQCVTCSSATDCESCTNSDASIVPDNLCQCNSGFFGDGIFCSETNPCEGIDCTASGDTAATCIPLTPETHECSCSSGYEDVASVCVDVDACVSAVCGGGGDDAAVCEDLPPPSETYACTCSPGYVDVNPTGCQPCPTGCSGCNTDISCTTCFDTNADISSRGICECVDGFFASTTADGTPSCTLCQIPIPGCVSCNSSTRCNSCAVGELAVDRTECIGAAGQAVVMDTSQEEESGGSAAGVIVGLISALSVTVICVVLLLLARRRSNGNKMFKFSMDAANDSTMKIDGDSFNNYLKTQIGKSKPIATGGFGAVYKVTLENGTVVALKVLNPAADQAAQAEFHRECTILTKLTVLNSPLIVSMVCFCDDPVCMGMDYASKGTLLDRLKDGPMTGEKLYKTVKEAALPLEFLHRKEFVHLDVKPQNFLVMEDERVVLCDFGLSMELSEPMTVASGTPQYLAPERFYFATWKEAGEAPVPLKDPRACDVFSFGCMAAAFANGEVPFQKTPASGVATLIAERNMRPPLPEDADEWFVRMCKKSWSQFPDDRPTMRDILTWVNEVVDPDSTALVSGTSNASFVSVDPDATSIISRDPSPRSSNASMQSINRHTGHDYNPSFMSEALLIDSVEGAPSNFPADEGAPSNVAFNDSVPAAKPKPAPPRRGTMPSNKGAPPPVPKKRPETVALSSDVPPKSSGPAEDTGDAPPVPAKKAAPLVPPKRPASVAAKPKPAVPSKRTTVAGPPPPKKPAPTEPDISSESSFASFLAPTPPPKKVPPKPLPKHDRKL